MTLTTTPGDPAADSYVTTAEADTYFAARGIAAWTGTDTVKENALRVATTYLDNQYRGRWVGLTATQLQSLAWPRVDGSRTLLRGWTYPLLDINGWQILSTVVPQQVKNATFEAAVLALSGVVLEPQLVRGGMIKSTSVQVDVIKEETVYMDGAPAIDRFIVIEGLLRGLVTSTPGSVNGNTPLVRA